MRILFLSKDFSYNGGGERMLSNLANELSHNNEISIISFDKTERDCLYSLDKNISYIRADISARKINIFTKLDYIKYLRKHISFLNEFDVIIGVGIICNLVLAIIAKEVVSDTIAWEHCSYKGIPYWQQIIRKILFPHLNKVICLTNEDLPKYKRINNNSYVIYNFTNIIYEKKPNLQAKRFIYIGRLTKEKGFDSLLYCIKQFCELNDKWTFEIIGDGKYSIELEKLMNDSRFKKRISYLKETNMVQKELENCSCMLMMSRHEGLPMVLIEAQTCGLPVISFDTRTGPKEIIADKKTGFIVPENDRKAFLNAMLDISNDENLLHIFSNEAVLQSRLFSKDIILPLWGNILAE